MIIPQQYIIVLVTVAAERQIHAVMLHISFALDEIHFSL